MNASTTTVLGVELRTDEARLTWKNAGPDLVFRLTGPSLDLTIHAGPDLIRQMKQMISWADPMSAPPDRPILARPNGCQ
jgi:hypothetical protein